MTKTEQTIWTVTTTFINREDAIAFRDMIEGMGLTITINQQYAGPAKVSPASQQRLGMTILEEMEKYPNETWNSEDLQLLCEEHKYAPTSWGAIISALVKEGKVEKLTRGLYRLPRRSVTIAANAA